MNFPIDVYDGVSQFEIEAIRQTSEGKEYTLNHPQELVVNMRYKGIDSSSANSQGWERNSTYYFKELLEKHPEYFSKKNKIRIQNGESPRVDARFIQAFPQYSGFENDILIHHHVGKDGQAVAVPQSIHKGSGEIHIYENNLGITDNAKIFSDFCRTICENNPEMKNHTSDEFKDSQKKMNHSEPEVKPDTDMQGDLETSKQETNKGTEEKTVDEQKPVDSQQQEMAEDCMQQKQSSEERRSRDESTRKNDQASLVSATPTKNTYPRIEKQSQSISRKTWIERSKDWVFDKYKKVETFYHRHKDTIDTVVEEVGPIVVNAVANKLKEKAIDTISRKKSPSTRTSDQPAENCSGRSANKEGYSDISATNIPGEEKPLIDSNVEILPSDKEKRNSPQEHMVSANTQRYHTKNGVEYRKKKPYISPNPDKKKS